MKMYKKMYQDIRGNVSETVTIMGIPFYAENITADTPYNYRERNFTPILGGTENVTKGKYVHREFSFTTTIYFPTGRPHDYDSIFKEMMSKPVKVISPYMGGKSTFNAMVTIQKTSPEYSPNHMDLDVKIVEVPKEKSNIPGEEPFTVPAVKKVTVSKSNKNCKKMKIPAGFTSSGKLSKKMETVEMCELQDGIYTSVTQSSKSKSKKKKATKKSKNKKSKKK